MKNKCFKNIEYYGYKFDSKKVNDKKQLVFEFIFRTDCILDYYSPHMLKYEEKLNRFSFSNLKKYYPYIFVPNELFTCTEVYKNGNEHILKYMTYLFRLETDEELKARIKYEKTYITKERNKLNEK